MSFLARPLSNSGREKLKEFESDIDKFHTHGCEVYWKCAVKQSDSKFSNAVFERKMGLSATFRGMKTVVRLAAKYAAQKR